MRPLLPGLAALFLLASPVAAQEAAEFRADAFAVEGLVEAQYAYLERLPGGRFPDSAVLKAEAAAVHDRRSLLAYAERAVAALADHHAITGSSFADSWALVPSYADLWVEAEGDGSTLRLAPHLALKPSAKSLREWEQRLPDRQFVRIHRSCLVAKAQITGFDKEGGDGGEARWVVTLAGLEEKLPVSRRQQHIVKELGRIVL